MAIELELQVQDAVSREQRIRDLFATLGGGMGTREFVRMAGGDVHVESDVGKGTRFFISIPLASTT